MALSPFSLCSTITTVHFQNFLKLTLCPCYTLMAPLLPSPAPATYFPSLSGLAPCVCACVLNQFSHVRLFVTLWTVACQAPRSMGPSRQESWRGLPCPPPEIFPTQGPVPVPRLLRWQADSSPPCPPTSGITQTLPAVLTHPTERSVLQGPRLLLSEFGALWADRPGGTLFFDLSGPQ